MSAMWRMLPTMISHGTARSRKVARTSRTTAAASYPMSRIRP